MTRYLLLGVLCFIMVVGCTDTDEVSQQITGLQGQIDNLQSQNQKLSIEITALKTSIDEKDAEILDLSDRLQRYEDDPGVTGNLDSGAFGLIEYGEGDCMPCGCESGFECGCPEKEYSPYDGKIALVSKILLDFMGVPLDDDYSSVIESSDQFEVTNGSYDIRIDHGIYVLMPVDMYQYGDNVITIPKETFVEKDFQFFRCTSY